MNRSILRGSLNFVALFFCILIYGCVSIQNEMGSPAVEKNGVLQHIGSGICQETKSGRMWKVERGVLFFSSQEAEKYAENLKLGGHNDWRLPTKEEFLTLYQIFYWKKNGDCSMNRAGEYWYRFEDRMSSPGHFETYYLCGPEFKFVESQGKQGYVRAVRP